MRKKKKNNKHPEQKFIIKSFVENKNGLLLPSLFLITAAACVMVATALPYYDSSRLFFTVFVSFALVLFSLLSEASARIEGSGSRLNEAMSNKYLRTILPVLICFIAIFDFGMEFRVYRQHFEVYTDAVQLIDEKVASGEKNIVIHKREDIASRLLNKRRMNSFVYYWTIFAVSDDPDDMLNKWYAYCIGADTIVGLE